MLLSRQSAKHHYASSAHQILGRCQALSFTRLHEIPWTRKTRIRYQQPIAGLPLLDLKFHLVRACVHHDVDIVVIDASSAQTVRKRLASGRKIGLLTSGPIPMDVLAPVLAACDRGMRLAEGDHPPDEAEDIVIGVQ